MEGFVAREKWIRADFATPEAAVQSFFAAIVSGDPEQIIRCVSPEDAEQMRKEMARDPDNFRRGFQSELGKLGKVAGLRITGSRQIDDDRMEISVQVSAGGESHEFPVRRFGNEWKLDK
jgi:hypothetical protein